MIKSNVNASLLQILTISDRISWFYKYPKIWTSEKIAVIILKSEKFGLKT